jgi:hypothetical protein
MLINELLMSSGKFTPAVTFPSTSFIGVPFSWSISGGQPGEGYWITTTSPSHPTYGSSSSYYGTLDGTGAATITGWNFSPDIGTYTVIIYFQYSYSVTKTITSQAAPITFTYDLLSITSQQTTNTTMIAVGTGGTILRSTDSGSTWHVVTSGVTTTLRSVTYGYGYYVAVGDAGVILYSTNDGVSWTKFTGTGYNTNYNFFSTLIDGSPYFYAAGNGNGSYNVFLQSIPSGSPTGSWLSVENPTGYPLYQAAGTITGSSWHSGVNAGYYTVVMSTGQIWQTYVNSTAYTLSPYATGDTFTGNLWGSATASNYNCMVVGAGGAIFTTNGQGTFHKQGAGFTSNILYNVRAIGSYFVIVGAGGTLISTPIVPNMLTDNSITLTNYSPTGINTNTLYDISFTTTTGSNVSYVAVGAGGTIIKSFSALPNSFTMINNGSTVKNVYNP